MLSSFCWVFWYIKSCLPGRPKLQACSQQGKAEFTTLPQISFGRPNWRPGAHGRQLNTYTICIYLYPSMTPWPFHICWLFHWHSIKPWPQIQILEYNNVCKSSSSPSAAASSAASYASNINQLVTHIISYSIPLLLNTESSILDLVLLFFPCLCFHPCFEACLNLAFVSWLAHSAVVVPTWPLPCLALRSRRPADVANAGSGGLSGCHFFDAKVPVFEE